MIARNQPSVNVLLSVDSSCLKIFIGNKCLCRDVISTTGNFYNCDSDALQCVSLQLINVN